VGRDGAGYGDGVDLYYWNMSNNHLAYARQSFQDLYGAAQDRFQRRDGAAYRRAGASDLFAGGFAMFGPLNGGLDVKIEGTFGYNPLELARYHRYMQAVEINPGLLNGLAATAKINPANGSVSGNPASLPRIYAPRSVNQRRRVRMPNSVSQRSTRPWRAWSRAARRSSRTGRSGWNSPRIKAIFTGRDTGAITRPCCAWPCRGFRAGMLKWTVALWP